MNHKSRSHHANVLMGGHNPEHNSHHKHRSGATHGKPCDILMRQHHYNGGITNTPPHFSEGGEARQRHYNGGITNKAPRYATGGHVDHEKRGGRPRRHRADGGDMYPSQIRSMSNGIYARKKRFPSNAKIVPGYGEYAEGGSPEKEYGEKPLTGQLCRGGRANHYEGEPVRDNSVRQEQKRGGRSKRKGHYWGQDVIGRLPLVGGIANTIANTAGTLDDDKYGGANYVADTTGRKVADVASTVGNLLPLAFLKKGGKVHRRQRHYEGEPVQDNSVRQEQKRGGRSKRKGHYWGQDVIGRLPLIGGVANSIANTVGTLDDDQYGGANYVADTAGRKAADIASTVGNLGLNLLMAKGSSKGKGAPAAPKKKGGGVYRHHHAAGGAGKVRKGMMTQSGRMIHND